MRPGKHTLQSTAGRIYGGPSAIAPEPGSIGSRTARTPTPTPDLGVLLGVQQSVNSGVISGALTPLIQSWATLWDAPTLLAQVTIRKNVRLRTTVARWVISTSCLEIGPRFLMLRHGHAEVLCHECAHAVVAAKYGIRAAPHGPEWRRLVTLAGYPSPTRTLTRRVCHAVIGRSHSVRAFEHRCQVCQAVRYAKQRMRAWRCVECTMAGLSGELTITGTNLLGMED
jgi:predicted SprT family Zn-dependent metalloprotease